MEIIRQFYKTKNGETVLIHLTRNYDGSFRFAISRNNDMIFDVQFRDTIPTDEFIVNNDNLEKLRKGSDLYAACLNLILAIEKP